MTAARNDTSRAAALFADAISHLVARVDDAVHLLDTGEPDRARAILYAQLRELAAANIPPRSPERPRPTATR